jgi:phosphate transport system substrate-binding protein
MHGSYGLRWAGIVLSAALTVLTMTGVSLAQTATLRSSDGSVTITGPLIRFDGKTYTIKSPHDELSLQRSEFSCVAGSCPSPNGFGIYGSNTIGAELMPRLIEAYVQLHDERARTTNGSSADETEIRVMGRDGKTLATIDLQAHGSATATPGLVNGRALIGMASRPLNTAEIAQLAERGLGEMRSPGKEHVLGLDGIIVIVSPANPVGKLPLQQLQRIFSGAISDWSEVGGAPGKINVYARDAKSGTFDTFKTLVLDPGEAQLTLTARRFESSNELSDLVANDVNGIGFIGFAYLRSAKAVSLVNECGMTFAPSTFGVKAEEYPLSRRLFLYSGKLPDASFAAGLLDFSLSMAAQPIVRNSGFIDQEPEWQSANQADRAADAQLGRKGADDPAIMLARDIKNTSRFSATLRFRYSSTELDTKALKDVEVIAQFLVSLRQTKSEKKLILAGFSDSAGSVSRNIALSIERANAVRQALLRKDPQFAPLIDTRGYGPILPVACNETALGRDKNRRVEVWLR